MPVAMSACSSGITTSSTSLTDGGVELSPAATAAAAAAAERVLALRFRDDGHLLGPMKLPTTSSSESLRLMLSVGVPGLELYDDRGMRSAVCECECECE
jgi:hypothetical protein